MISLPVSWSVVLGWIIRVDLREAWMETFISWISHLDHRAYLDRIRQQIRQQVGIALAPVQFVAYVSMVVQDCCLVVGGMVRCVRGMYDNLQASKHIELYQLKDRRFIP